MHIVIEGQDATGKDTQAKLLADYLQKKGYNVVHYAESGTGSDDHFIKNIAELTYGSSQDIDNRTRVLLYLINRYEQWRKLAEPALRNNDIVITTRSWLSTLIYEGYVGKVSKSTIIKVHKTIMPEHYFKPDKIVIMTLSDAARAERLAAQGRAETEFWKSKPKDTQFKINQSYLRVAKEYNVPTLDASGTIDEVQESLRKLFEL